MQLSGFPGKMYLHDEIESTDELWKIVDEASEKGYLVTTGSHVSNGNDK